jgi:hypothetical protein
MINVLLVFLLLLLFSFIGAIVFPGLPTTNTTVGDFGRALLLLVLPVFLMAIIGYFLGRGIRSIKSSFEALGLTYVSAFLVGGVLALLTILNFSYSAHVNFTWLGTSWYAPLFTIFLIGAPITLAFLA